MATPPAQGPAVAEECVSGSGCARPVCKHGLSIAVSRTDLPRGMDARRPRVPHLGCPTDGRCHRGSGRRGGSGSVFILQAWAFATLQLCRGGPGTWARGEATFLCGAPHCPSELRVRCLRVCAVPWSGVMWPWGNARIRVCLEGRGKKKGKKKAQASPIFAKAAVSTFRRWRGSKVQMKSKFQSPLATSPRSMVSGTDPPPPDTHTPLSPARRPGR